MYQRKSVDKGIGSMGDWRWRTVDSVEVLYLISDRKIPHIWFSRVETGSHSRGTTDWVYKLDEQHPKFQQSFEVLPGQNYSLSSRQGKPVPGRGPSYVCLKLIHYDWLSPSYRITGNRPFRFCNGSPHPFLDVQGLFTKLTWLLGYIKRFRSQSYRHFTPISDGQSNVRPGRIESTSEYQEWCSTKSNYKICRHEVYVKPKI